MSYADDHRFSAPRKSGQAETKVTKEAGAVVQTTEHWDGRKDATVTPDVVRYGARVHNQGKKRGDLAEIRVLDHKERRERYGDEG